ncbi:hypothetical protein VT84_15565 [Gemmata sp. SH-PL17]|nr:hypothetical protein VT84_15565 [Gemmata sp. SH-PL17]
MFTVQSFDRVAYQLRAFRGSVTVKFMHAEISRRLDRSEISATDASRAQARCNTSFGSRTHEDVNGPTVLKQVAQSRGVGTQAARVVDDEAGAPANRRRIVWKHARAS